MLAQFSDMNEKRDKLIETIAETTREFTAKNNNSSRQEKERIILTNDVILVAAQSGSLSVRVWLWMEMHNMADFSKERKSRINESMLCPCLEKGFQTTV